eukprot:gene5388-5610_t
MSELVKSHKCQHVLDLPGTPSSSSLLWARTCLGINAVVTEWVDIVLPPECPLYELVQACTRSARYTIELQVAPGTNFSGVKALVTEWVKSKQPPECPIEEELVFAEGSIVSAIYNPTEDEVPLSCTEWTLQAIAGLSTETQTDVSEIVHAIYNPTDDEVPLSCTEWTLQAIAGLSTETQTDVSEIVHAIKNPTDDEVPLACTEWTLQAIAGLSNETQTDVSRGHRSPAVLTIVVQEYEAAQLRPWPKSLTPPSTTDGVTPDLTPIPPPADDRSSASIGAIIGGVLGGLLLLLLLTCCFCWWFACCCFKHRKRQTTGEEAKNGSDSLSNYGSPLFMERLSAKTKNNEISDTMQTFDEQMENDQNNSQPQLKITSSKKIEVAQESNTPAGPLGQPTSAGSMSGPTLFNSSLDISRWASHSMSHTQGSRRGSQVEAFPQVGPRWASRSSSYLYSSSPGMSAAVGRQRTSLDVSTISSSNQDPTRSAPIWNQVTSPRQGPMIKPSAYPGDPGDLVSEPYMTGMLSGLAASSGASMPGRSIRTSSRNSSIRAGRSKSQSASYRRGSQGEASPQVGSRLPVSPGANLTSSGSPMSAGAWMQHTSLGGSTDGLQNPMQSGYAQDSDLATSPRQASMVEPDSYPGEPGGPVSKPSSPSSTPSSLFSTLGSLYSTPSPFSTQGDPFSHSPDRGSEMGPVLPTRKSQKRPSVSFRASSTSYPTQVADRAKPARLSGRKSFNGIDERKMDQIARAYSAGGNGKTCCPVISGGSHSFVQRKMDVKAPTERESMGRDLTIKNAWTKERAMVGANKAGPPLGANSQLTNHQGPSTSAIRSPRLQATIAGALSRSQSDPIYKDLLQYYSRTQGSAAVKDRQTRWTTWSKRCLVAVHNDLLEYYCSTQVPVSVPPRYARICCSTTAVHKDLLQSRTAKPDGRLGASAAWWQYTMICRSTTAVHKYLFQYHRVTQVSGAVLLQYTRIYCSQRPPNPMDDLEQALPGGSAQ